MVWPFAYPAQLENDIKCHCEWRIKAELVFGSLNTIHV